MKPTWWSKKWVIVALHVLCWLLFFSLPFFLRPSEGGGKIIKTKNLIDRGIILHFFVNCIAWVMLFYTNAYLLLPRFFYRKQHGRYFISLVMVLLLLGFANWAAFSLLVPNRTFDIKPFIIFFFFPCLFMIASSTAFVAFRDKIKQDKISAQKETENLKTELSFLRSQVSPHFMFNILNNMVALARKRSEDLEPSLIKLSALLRYMLYETDEEKVPLEKEVEYLQSYIDLQTQRFGKNVQINADLADIDKTYYIEPMLLIPFVENAFKHGTGLVQQPQIEISLKAKNHLLHFYVRNRFSRAAHEIKDKTSGIGLTNVKRRLNLLYGKRHSLLINDDHGWFTVSLQIHLS